MKRFKIIITFWGISLFFLPKISALSFTNNGICYSERASGVYVVSLPSGKEYKGNIVIPERVINYEVTGIGKNAFSNCKELTSVTLPTTVTTIEEDAFSGCSGLSSINIPDGVTSIDRKSVV